MPLRKIKEKIKESQPVSPKEEVRQILPKKSNETKPIRDFHSQQIVKRQDNFSDLYAEFKQVMETPSDAWNDNSKKTQLEEVLVQLKQILNITP